MTPIPLVTLNGALMAACVHQGAMVVERGVGHTCIVHEVVHACTAKSIVCLDSRAVQLCKGRAHIQGKNLHLCTILHCASCTHALHRGPDFILTFVNLHPYFVELHP